MGSHNHHPPSNLNGTPLSSRVPVPVEREEFKKMAQIERPETGFGSVSLQIWLLCGVGSSLPMEMTDRRECPNANSATCTMATEDLCRRTNLKNWLKDPPPRTSSRDFSRDPLSPWYLRKNALKDTFEFGT